MGSGIGRVGLVNHTQTIGDSTASTDYGPLAVIINITDGNLLYSSDGKEQCLKIYMPIVLWHINIQMVNFHSDHWVSSNKFRSMSCTSTLISSSSDSTVSLMPWVTVCRPTW